MSGKIDPMFQGSSPFFQDVLRRRKYTSMTDHGGIIINNGGGGDGEGGKWLVALWIGGLSCTILILRGKWRPLPLTLSL